MLIWSGEDDPADTLLPRLLAAGVIAAMLPDADVLAFALHIPYADAFGHRGASHSLLFAGVLAAVAAVLAFFGSGRPWSALLMRVDQGRHLPGARRPVGLALGRAGRWPASAGRSR